MYNQYMHTEHIYYTTTLIAMVSCFKQGMTYNTPTNVGCFTEALAIILLYYTLPAANLGILQNDTLYPTF